MLLATDFIGKIGFHRGVRAMFGVIGGNSQSAQFSIVPMDLSVLTGWYAAQNLAATANSLNLAASQAAPTSSARGPSSILPPWDIRRDQVSEAARLRDALSAGDLIDLNDPAFSGEEVPEDHRKLFALYKALNTLATLAGHATKEDTPTGTLNGLNGRFQSGLPQVFDYLAATTFEEMTVLSGEKTNNTKSIVAVPRTLSEYKTDILVKGSLGDPIEHVAGNETFTVSVLKFGVTTNVDIDLSQMAGDVTIDNVVAFTNTQLEAAGVISRFHRLRIDDGEYGIKLQGVSTETITLSAAATAPSLYVSGVSGQGDDQTGQVLKLGSLGSGDPTTEFSSKIDPENATANVAASAIDSDGNLYVVGNSNGDFGNQLNRGAQDVFLTKYDSVGKALWTRLLGASDTAEGFAVEVDSSDNVVVTGKVRGDVAPVAIGGGYDTFVTKYNEAGEEQFTRQISPLSDDGGADVAIAADGSIFIVGHTRSAMNSTVTHSGGLDAYVTKLDASGNLAYHRQFGSSGDERATSVAIANDGDLIVGSVEDGVAVVRKFASADGASAAIWETTLGGLSGGALGGIKVDGSSVYVVGSTGNTSLDAGGAATLNNAHSGGIDGFLMRIDDAGASAVANYTTYVGTSGADAVGDLTISGGEIYVVGETTGAMPGESQALVRSGFASKFDAAGALQWTHQYAAHGGYATANAIEVDPAGSSVLDALGLPKGEITYGGSTRLTANSTLREGDSFSISVDGGVARKIRIEAGETMRTLALKINLLVVFDAKASVYRGSDGDQLEIEVNEGVELELISGPSDSDALAGLGLVPGKLINDGSLLDDDDNDDGDDDKTTSSTDPIIFGLGLENGLNLRTKTDAAHATQVLQDALSAIRSAYRDLTRDPILDQLADLANQGSAPAHLTAQLANYQAGLARLSAGAGQSLFL
jgi:hypothetical protein